MGKLNFWRFQRFAGLRLASFLLALLVAVQAQVTGTIGGYATDPGGAAVAEGTVTATLVQQNLSRTVQTSVLCPQGTLQGSVPFGVL